MEAAGMSNIHDYYRKNSLYEGHRLMLPELRDKVAHTCDRCKYYVIIAGKTEVRTGCAALIPCYSGLVKPVPGKLDAADVLKAVGRDGLERVLAGPGNHSQACGQFHPKRKQE
jgi:hypothetical protein